VQKQSEDVGSKESSTPKKRMIFNRRDIVGGDAGQLRTQNGGGNGGVVGFIMLGQRTDTRIEMSTGLKGGQLRKRCRAEGCHQNKGGAERLVNKDKKEHIANQHIIGGGKSCTVGGGDYGGSGWNRLQGELVLRKNEKKGGRWPKLHLFWGIGREKILTTRGRKGIRRWYHGKKKTTSQKQGWGGSWGGK